MERIEDMWERYSRTRSVRDRDALVERYYGLVRTAARKLSMRTGRSDSDAFLSAGGMVLVAAVEGFDPSLGVPFDIFALRRIYGEMTRSMAELDGRPQLAQRREKRYKAAHDRFYKKHGRRAGDDELLAAGEVTKSEVRDGTFKKQLLDVGCGRGEGRIDGRTAGGEGAREVGVVGWGVGDGVGEGLLGLVEALVPIERSIVLLHFVEEMDDAEIGAALGLTRDEVFKRRRLIVDRLRDGQERIGGLFE